MNSKLLFVLMLMAVTGCAASPVDQTPPPAEQRKDLISDPGFMKKFLFGSDGDAEDGESGGDVESDEADSAPAKKTQKPE